jgi:hypothetical protein
LVLLVSACQSLRKPVVPDVPAAITSNDLSRIESALSASPNSLAVFDAELAATPLDPSRSGVIVDLDRQRSYIYSQARLVAATRIASGKKNFRTPTGDYRIGQKNPKHASNLYGKLRHIETGEDLPGEIDTRATPVPEGMVFLGAPMPYFMRFHEIDGKASAIFPIVPLRTAVFDFLRAPRKPSTSFSLAARRFLSTATNTALHPACCQRPPKLPPRSGRKEKAELVQAGRAGCCWVRQWKAPSPQINSRQSIGTIRREGNAS